MIVLASPPQRYVQIFFLDGVGLGGAEAEVNPFVRADLPHLEHLLESDDWYLLQAGLHSGKRATVKATDANVGVPRRPQSATGQAIILTGRNVSQIVGEHYGPKPNAAVAEQIKQGTLFSEVVEAGGRAALLTPYPQGYFDAIASGRRLLSSVPLAASHAGVALMDAEDLRHGRAVSPGFTGQGWRDHLGYADMPLLSLEQAGEQIARLATEYHFSFFEHWPSDRSGHRGPLSDAITHLEMLDSVVGGLVNQWDDEKGLLIITSDHGNLEEKNHRKHTRNPVPTIIVGREHAKWAAAIDSLIDIAAVVRRFLGLASGPQ